MNILRKEPNYIFNSKGRYEIRVVVGPWFYVYVGTNPLDEREEKTVARFYTKERATKWIEDGANEDELFAVEEIQEED